MRYSYKEESDLIDRYMRQADIGGEIYAANCVIGLIIGSNTGTEMPTRYFSIRYSKNEVPIVPQRRDNHE